MTSVHAVRPLIVLIVEDDPLHARLLARSLAESGPGVEVEVAGDGESALALLRGVSAAQGWQRPDLVLLDLGLPGMGGAEFLRTLKADPQLGAIPVIVVSSQDDDDEVIQAYEGGANCFVGKASGFRDSAAFAQGVRRFWGSLVSLPPVAS